MKRHICFYLAAALLFWLLPRANAQVYVQSASNRSNGVTSLSVTLTGAVAGHGIAILWEAEGTSPTISDNASDTFATDATNSSQSAYTALQHIQATAGGDVTITVSQSTAKFIAIYAAEVSTPIKFDAGSLVNGVQTTTPWSQDFTTAVRPVEFVFANAITEGSNAGNTCVDGTFTTIGADGN